MIDIETSFSRLEYQLTRLALAAKVDLGLVIKEEVPANQRDMVTLLLGTLAGMASSVVAYWVGSSNGSMQKNAALEKALANR